MGVVAAGGFGALAGCPNEQDDPSIPDVPNEPDYRGWFNGVSNYEATRDYRGRESVTVRVGVGANGGRYGFGPAAIAVSPGTVVTWEWTGEGGQHNVVAEAGAFDSGQPVDSDDETFEHTFEDPAVYRYVCEPHRLVGMRGTVFVSLGQQGE